MQNILYAVIVLGGMGLLFGGVLTVASRFFAVPTNPKRDKVREALPGANCGACGFPGCDACADAIASGKASPNACPVGGAPVAAKIGEIMGVEAEKTERKVARVICQGDVEHCKTKFNYKGIQDCVAASLVSDGDRACKYACLGLGTCVRACPFDAIHIDERLKIAVVDADKCQSCGKCIDACPRGVLDLQPVSLPVRVQCRAAEEGFLVSDNCRVGCIGCERCAIACKFGAITLVNNLPKFDMSKCTRCMRCYEVCPTHAIWADVDHRLIAEIDKKTCIGCGMCKRTCQFEAVAGELRQKHTITAACTGCGECAKKCPKKCITMKVREHTRDRHAKIGASKEAVLAVKPTEGATAARPKPQYSPEVQAKIDAALKAKAAKEAAAATSSNPMVSTEKPAELDSAAAKKEKE